MINKQTIKKKNQNLIKNNIDFGAIINIILVHCNSPDQYTLTISLFWIKEFIVIGKENLLPFSPQILHAIFRSITLSEKEKYKSIVEISMETNITLQNLIKETNHDFSVQDLINSITVEGLCSQYVETKICSLNWIINLHLKFGDNLNEYYDQLFPELLKTLSEPDDQVVRLAIQVLAKLSTSELNFKKLMKELVEILSKKKKLLEDRGILVIRQLSNFIKPEIIFIELSQILEKEEHTEFAYTMIQILNIILLTAPEVVDLKNSLKSLENEKSKEFFITLYKSWCHNPAAAFSICLLSQVYELSSELVFKFAELEVSVNLLVEIDKLVQLLESPIFMYLRLQLLEPEKYPFLFKSLYGLLMLLPQSKAFDTLRKRLKSIGSMSLLQLIPKGESEVSNPFNLNYTELLNHFVETQRKHTQNSITEQLEREKK